MNIRTSVNNHSHTKSHCEVIINLVKRKGCSVIIDYSPLWKTMEEKGISQYKLLKNGVDNRTLDSLKHNRNITMNTLAKLCKIIDCTPNDVVRFYNNEK